MLVTLGIHVDYATVSGHLSDVRCHIGDVLLVLFSCVLKLKL